MIKIALMIDTGKLAKYELEGCPITVEQLQPYETVLKDHEFDSFTDENDRRLEYEVSTLLCPVRGKEYFVRMEKTKAKLTRVYMNFKRIGGE